MRPTTLALALCAATSTASSLWQPLEVIKRELEPLKREIDLIFPGREEKRQDSTSKFNLSFSATQGQIAPSTSTASATQAESTAATKTASGDSTKTEGDSTKTGGDSTKTDGDSSETGKSKSKGKSDTKTTKKPSSSTSIDPRSPAGGISMVTPNVIAGAQYYKIKDWVTFAWNYTSLIVTPSYIDILASCSANQATYTIALNQSVQETQTVLWDTEAYQANASIPLLTETYTLIVHDAGQAVSATARPGYLGTYQQFTFGMYTPQAYTPMDSYVCATCNGAMTAMEKNTISFIFGMVAVTVLSFGWFTGVAGLW
ncbi:hypothetical protein K431DRAFT_281970 [Polychaeton citri CBS 116435]|uniref:DUF7137 domain-containing protein n=1 Tax=Polychaeton citri CBS 116435 TaxID=1314669 RepID=A0A9P4QEU1_9PEZI|nr:hypothetical protein K431DRAFT_281970 [Polychaeton citri CBS 116435]